MKRLNLPSQRDAIHGEQADGTGTPPGIPTLAAGGYKFNLLYPKIKQNPGY